MENMDHIPREDFDNVRIATSRLRDQNNEPIGIGLFANKEFNKGAYLCLYGGERVLTSEAKKTDYVSRYVLQWGKYSIDGSDFNSSFARFANDPIVKSKINAQLVKHENGTTQHPIFKLTATKHIKKHDEIYTSYGDSYWMHHEVFEALNGDLQYVITNRNKTIKKWVEANYWM
jgi:hypothetical protein